jgi:hypothetical protein
MLHKSFEEMGIPSGYGFRKLLYCASAGVLIVQTQPLQGWRPDRLLARSSSAERYEPIGTPDEVVSQDDPVVSCSHPLLAYNSMRHSFRLDEEGKELHAATWEAVRVLDLTGGRETHVVDRETLHLPDRTLDVWIVSLLGFADSHECLHIVAGFSREYPSNISHYVSELHLPSGLVRPLVNLPAAFL